MIVVDDSKSSDGEYKRDRLINKFMRKFNWYRHRASKPIDAIFVELRYENFRMKEGIDGQVHLIRMLI